MKSNEIMVTVILCLVVGAAAFFAGTKYQQSKQTSFAGTRQFTGQPNQTGRRMGQGQPQGNRQGFRPVTGQIISSDDKSITIKMQDASSKIVFIDNNTEINKADAATKADLKTGDTVAVFGQDNSDGSVTARNIQLNPVMINSSQPSPNQ